MAGKTVYDNTYLTPKLTYRQNIAVADVGPDVVGLPTIRLDVDQSLQHYEADVTQPVAYQVTGRAYNGHLELYCYLTPSDPAQCDISTGGLVNGLLSQADQRCHADIMVWAWGGPDDGLIDGRWCLIHNQSILIDSAIVLRNVPNTRYRVTVQFLSPACTVDIVEQHTL